MEEITVTAEVVCVDPCAADPCQNNGHCVSGMDDDDVIGFYCECLPGFYGLYCEDGSIHFLFNQLPCIRSSMSTYIILFIHDRCWM